MYTQIVEMIEEGGQPKYNISEPKHYQEDK